MATKVLKEVVMIVALGMIPFMVALLDRHIPSYLTIGQFLVLGMPWTEINTHKFTLVLPQLVTISTITEPVDITLMVVINKAPA